MEYIEGFANNKGVNIYYIDNGVIYRCVRDSEIPLYTSLANVVDNYVQLA